MPIQARLFAPGMAPEDLKTLTAVGALCWGTFVFVTLALPLRAAMSVQGRIWPGAGAQLLRSGGLAACLITMIFAFGRRDVTALAHAANFGGFCVLVSHLLALTPKDRRRVVKGLCNRKARSDLQPILWALGAVFLTQVVLAAGRLIDWAVATGLPVGTLASLEYSYALLMAFGALIGTSTNLVFAPRIARDMHATKRLNKSHWRLVLLVGGLSTVCGIILSLLATPIIALVFERGAFGPEATRQTAEIFALHALGLGPLVVALIMAQILLVGGGHRLVLALSIAKMGGKILALWALLAMGWGITGIAFSLVIAEIAAVIFFAIAMKVRLPYLLQQPRS